MLIVGEGKLSICSFLLIQHSMLTLHYDFTSSKPLTIDLTLLRRGLKNLFRREWLNGVGPDE
jgi:hypothetical protein